MLSHEDVDVGALEPLELSDYMTWYQKLEIIFFLCTYALSLLIANWIFVLVLSPVALFNLQMLVKKSYVQRFMFMREYKNRDYMLTVMTVKLVFYLIYLVVSLFMFVYKIASFLADY